MSRSVESSLQRDVMALCVFMLVRFYDYDNMFCMIVGVEVNEEGETKVISVWLLLDLEFTIC